MGFFCLAVRFVCRSVGSGIYFPYALCNASLKNSFLFDVLFSGVCCFAKLFPPHFASRGRLVSLNRCAVVHPAYGFFVYDLSCGGMVGSATLSFVRKRTAVAFCNDFVRRCGGVVCGLFAGRRVFVFFA